MIIEKNSVISMDYLLTGDDGEEIDSSKERGPLTFIQGTGNIIPGLDNAFLGKKIGDAFKVHVEPEDAYGKHDETLIKVIPRDQLDNIPNIRVGMPLQVQLDQDNVMVVTITNISDKEVTLDGNHPLAGIALNFAITVTDVRQATQEELAHGHIHGEEGCCGGDCEEDCCGGEEEGDGCGCGCQKQHD